MNVLKGFGARIKIAREQAGLSQSQLAAKAGYTDRSSIAKLEKGQIDPSSSKITQIARALDVSEAWLLGWETDRMEDMVTVDGETARIAQGIFEDTDLRLLFADAHKASPQQLKTLHNLLKDLKRMEQHPDDQVQ